MLKNSDVSFATRVSNKLFPKRAARKATLKVIGEMEAVQSYAKTMKKFRER